MKITLIKYFFATILLFLISTNIQAQTFGFGCLGLSGFYAGISQEQYDAKGINDFLNYQLSANSSIASSTPVKFVKGTGYRIGANLFRAKFDKVFITAKGYYQFLKEERSTTALSNNTSPTSNHIIKLNHWGIGVDFGVNLFWILDWKVIEGDVTFYSAELSSSYFEYNVNNNLNTVETKYNLDKTEIGYYLGSGLILHLIPDYISIEGTAGFNFVKIGKLKRIDGSGNELFINNAIPAGGFSATIQLNVGFPL